MKAFLAAAALAASLSAGPAYADDFDSAIASVPAAALSEIKVRCAKLWPHLTSQVTCVIVEAEAWKKLQTIPVAKSATAVGGRFAGVNVGVLCSGIHNANAILNYFRTDIIDSISHIGGSPGLVLVGVSTDKWQALEPVKRTLIATVAYCSVADSNGEGAAIIQGSAGERLAGVTAGKYGIE